jgi:hypothetical protein
MPLIGLSSDFPKRASQTHRLYRKNRDTFAPQNSENCENRQNRNFFCENPVEIDQSHFFRKKPPLIGFPDPTPILPPQTYFGRPAHRNPIGWYTPGYLNWFNEPVVACSVFHLSTRWSTHSRICRARRIGRLCNNRCWATGDPELVLTSWRAHGTAFYYVAARVHGRGGSSCVLSMRMRASPRNSGASVLVVEHLERTGAG